MHLVAVGLNHKTAPLEVREKLTYSDSVLPNALDDLTARADVAEGIILSTCNRTEIYAAVHQDTSGREIVDFLSQSHGLTADVFASHLYRYDGSDAVTHLFRVAAGIDSMVLGEVQILRQVRDAFSAATSSGSAGPLLNALFRAAIATGRRARTETGISNGGFSIGHAAVDLARSIFGSLEGAAILVLGAGKMSELTAKHLVASGSKLVLVANRTHERAVELALKLGGKAIRYDDFPDTMITADVIISSTSAPHPIIRKEILQLVMKKRRGKPLFLIDIAVPRDIEAAVRELDNVFLYDVDDLQEVVEEMANEREGEKQRVESIVVEETDKYMDWWRTLGAAPLVTCLRGKHEQIRQAELARLKNQLPDISERAWACIDAATRSMMTRVGKDPISALKGASLTGDQAVLDAARALFGLAENEE